MNIVVTLEWRIIWNSWNVIGVFV